MLRVGILFLLFQSLKESIDCTVSRFCKPYVKAWNTTSSVH